MSKKAKIKKLQAANGKLAHEYKISEMARRMLIDDCRKFEHDLLMAKNKIEKLVDALNASDSYAAYLQAQVDELQESLGESQAGREALQRQIDTDGSKLIAATWREHATEVTVHADELGTALDAVVKERDYLKEVLGTIVSLAI